MVFARLLVLPFGAPSVRLFLCCIMAFKRILVIALLRFGMILGQEKDLFLNLVDFMHISYS